MTAHRKLPFFVLVLALAALAPAHLLAAPTPTSAARDEESTCVPEQNQVAYPNVVLLGETTTTTLTVKALCAAEAWPLHIVLVLDGSPATTTAARRYEYETALGLVEDLRLPDYPQIGVGIVVFGGPDVLSCDLTSEVGRLKRCIDQVLDAPTETGDVDDLGLDEAMAVLVAGRGQWLGNIREVVVLLTDAQCVASCRMALRAAGKVQRQGALVVTACASRQCARSCVRSLASSPRYFFDWPTARNRISAVFAKINDEVININIKRLTLTGTLADGTRYVPDSAAPAPDTVSADGRTFTWVTNYVPRDGVTVTLRIAPEVPGNHPSGLAATGQLLDNWNRTKEFAFPQPWTLVLGSRGDER
jgi:hypothetical protein